MTDERFSADALDLNEVVRGAVQKVGGTFVDIWSGFVDDKNRYVASGPDVEGKVTKLRTSGGVNLAKASGRKAAHSAEVELQRLIAARAGTGTASPAPGSPGTEITSPAESVSASVPIDSPKPMPIEGPVLPLTNPPVRPPGATLATGSVRWTETLTGREGQAVTGCWTRHSAQPPSAAAAHLEE